MINNIRKLLIYFLVGVSSLLINAAIYIRLKFGNDKIDEMLYYLFNGMDGTSKSVFLEAFKEIIIPLTILTCVLILPVLPLTFNREHKGNDSKKKRWDLPLVIFKFIRNHQFVYSFFLLIFSICMGLYLVGAGKYINRISEYSSFIENHYVDGRNVSIKFPDEKRNLIILYLESMENTLMDIENGGGWEYNVIPELTELANENINFSHNNKIGGPHSIPGTEWTVAGMVASSAGIPLKIPVNGNKYTETGNFLPGAYTLGDVLKENGYNLKLMVGSDADFGGRRNYYQAHGNYEIFDVYTAIEKGKMREDEQVWWGFEDSRLFEWAKEEIIDLAQRKEPFSISILTANTHFIDGYLENGAENIYESQYENVHAHSSKQVYDFINWLREQDFYEMTTIIIIGDHRSMQPGEFYSSKMVPGYYRTIYNTIINSTEEPIQSKNRDFTILDFYPTILASIGVEIEGDRLALGTNLFSERQTLVEELGIEYVREELGKNSHFYNKYILQDDYLKMLQQEK